MDEPESDDVSLQSELARARHHILRGDYEPGVGHLSLAAGLDPTDPDVEDLLEIVVDEVGASAADLVGIVDPEGAPAGKRGVQAWFLNATGRTDEAVTQILALSRTDPGRGWSSWLARWLDAGPSVRITTDEFLATFGDLLEPGDHTEASLAEAAAVAERTIAGDPGNGWLQSIASTLALRAGRLDDALAWAAAGEELAPSAMSASMLGHAQRAVGDEAGAAAAFQMASERAPDDVTARLEAADSLASLGEWDAAASWAAGGWKLDPESAGAASRTLFARYRNTGDVRHALELFAWLEQQESDIGPDAMARAATLSTELPWIGHLPLPVHGLIPVLDDLRAKAEVYRRGRLKVSLPAPEAPTALLALRHAVGRDLTVTVERIPDPDPRVPRGKVRTDSWALIDDELAPAVPPPNPGARAAVWLTPTPWYRLEVAARDAAHLAGGLPTINDMVSLALHPEPGPDNVSPWDWVRRWQVVCCLALAERDAFGVLCDLADGPEDWICDAALAGLVHLAQRRKDYRPRVLEFGNRHLVESFQRLGRVAVPYLGAECDLFELLPGRSDEDAAAARAVKAQWEALVDGEE